MKTTTQKPSARALRAAVSLIRTQESAYDSFNEHDFARLSNRLRNGFDSERVGAEKDVDSFIPTTIQASALFSAAVKRTLGIHLFDSQLRAALLLQKGFAVDMKTGEGKTLAAALGAYLHFLAGKTVCIVSFNEYLASRDFLYTERLFALLGIKTRLVSKAKSAETKGLLCSPGITFVSASALAQIKWSGTPCAVIDDIESVLPESDSATFTPFAFLCGIGGAAHYEKEFLQNAYGLTVVPIAGVKRTRRKDARDCVFKTTAEQINAICLEVSVASTRWGEPVLINVESKEKARAVKKALDSIKINAAVALATDEKTDAAIMENAGALGSVTISVKNAGFGVPVLLGGKSRTKESVVNAVGGLYVIGTKHAAKRKDDFLLRGKSGIHGENGTTRFFISKEESR